ncbi:hypothetical protein BGX28_009199 [Mortierella sp. GBA30]|nr:hypothetical protein BGX28_009199 [Mortierella sp. GBA30]
MDRNTVVDIARELPGRTMNAIEYRITALRNGGVAWDRKPGAENPRWCRWSPEEDLKLWRMVQKGWRNCEMFGELPGRTRPSILSRIAILRRSGEHQNNLTALISSLDHTEMRQIEPNTKPSEEEHEQKDQTGTMHKDKSIRHLSGKNDVLEKYRKRHTGLPLPCRGLPWTPEEDRKLEELVAKYEGQETLWNKVAEALPQNPAGDDGLRSNRSQSSCRSRWGRLQSSSTVVHGHWNKEEMMRLQDAIRDQVGDQTTESDGKGAMSVTTISDDGRKRREISKKVLLSPGEMRRLDWKKIAVLVGT